MNPVNTPQQPYRRFIWVAALILLVLHQDIWFWDSHRPMVFGFLPIGLAYHAAFSLMAAVIWALAIRFAWPYELEAMAAEDPEDSGDGRQA